jgi:hypothetical protein
VISGEAIFDTAAAGLAFRLKMRTDALEARSTSDPNAYAEKVKLGHDIAEVLRKNVVQAQKVGEAETESDAEVWRMYRSFFPSIILLRYCG